jgi:choline monooxygenase
MTELLSPDTLAPQQLDHALTLPARFYTDARMPALDGPAIFAKSWQLVCHQSQLRAAPADRAQRCIEHPRFP